jgi:hypothetical protein
MRVIFLWKLLGHSIEACAIATANHNLPYNQKLYEDESEFSERDFNIGWQNCAGKGGIKTD